MRKIMIEDLLRFRYVSDLQLSPDGKLAACIVRRAGADLAGYESELQVCCIETQKIQTVFSEPLVSFSWNDERTLVGFTREMIFTIDLEAGAHQIQTLPQPVEKAAVFGRGYLLQCKVDIQGESDENCLVFSEIPFWANGKGFINGRRSSLFYWLPESNCLTRLGPEHMDVAGWEISKDKTHLLFWGAEYDSLKNGFHSLYQYDADSGESCLCIPDKQYRIDYAGFVSKGVLFAGSPMDRYGDTQNAAFWLWREGNISLMAAPDLGLGNSVGTDCRLAGGKTFCIAEDMLHMIATVGTSSHIFRLEPEGSFRRITKACGSVNCFDYQNGVLACLAMRGSWLDALYVVENDGTEREIAAFNAEAEQEIETIQPIPFDCLGGSGHLIEGFVMKPVDYDPEQSYPGILYIHGGPKTVYGNILYHELQLFAARGYFVFFCNPRGSCGRGDDFAWVYGQFGTIDYDDLMEFTDEVLDAYPQIDRERVGVAGGSYGGYMVNWIITQTSRFSCACAQRSVASWLTTFGTCGDGIPLVEGQVPQGSLIAELNGKLREMSPYFFADRVTTPTLFIHSDNDFRTCVVEGVMMYSALKYHGVDTRLCMFHGEHHGLSRVGRPRNRIRRLEEIVGWFDTHWQTES